jgi:4-hydroxy-tetrahydrodipicolinate synthase
VPAHLIPFKEDLSIDEEALRRHVEWLVTEGRAAGVVSNGHAGEVSSLSRDERRRVVEIVVDQVRGRVPVIAGIYSDSTLEAQDLARDAARAGAQALLVFPPNTFAAGASKTIDLPRAWFKAIAQSVDVGLVVFQFPPAGGLGYTTEVLVQLVQEVPQIVGIKEGSEVPAITERNIRRVKEVRPDVAILTTNNTALLPTLILGADGILSGSGSVLSDLHAAMCAAVSSNDLHAAQAIYQRLFHTTQVFYADPLVNMHNRMKEALVLLGRLERAVVRPPLLRLSEEERRRIAAALERAGLMTAAARA